MVGRMWDGLRVVSCLLSWWHLVLLVTSVLRCTVSRDVVLGLVSLVVFAEVSEMVSSTMCIVRTSCPFGRLLCLHTRRRPRVQRVRRGTKFVRTVLRVVLTVVWFNGLVWIMVDGGRSVILTVPGEFPVNTLH